MFFILHGKEVIRNMAADGSVNIDSKIDGSGFSSGLSKMSGAAKKALWAMTGLISGATAAFGTAVVAIGKSAVSAYSNYEQLTGGVETLFKGSASLVEKYAANAYKTAGMSANDYMETVTGFSASLLQSVGGNTAKAAEVANMALTDMADNANKMGTSMESIRYAYQGFAKQNYTMLDNLKLGYGGTREEMKRLLADAQKITGVKYDINNLNDVYQAIHVIQGQLGITGTTAKEASTTIQGSAASMKAAWNNLLVGMADDTANMDALLGNLVDSVGTFAENLIPHIETALNSIAGLVGKIVPMVAAELPKLTSQLLPQIAEIGLSIFQSLLAGISESLPQLTSAAVSIITTLANGILASASQLATVGLSLITGIIQGITPQLPQIAAQAVVIAGQIVQGLLNALPTLVLAGMQIILGLIQGLTTAIPQLLPVIVSIVMQIAQILTDNIPTILQAGITLLLSIVQALPTVIQALVDALPELIQSIVNFLVGAIPQLIDGAIQLLMAIVDAIPEILPPLIKALPQIINTVISGLVKAIPKLIQGAIQFLMAIIQAIPTIIQALIQNLPLIISTIIKVLIQNIPLLIKGAIQLFMAIIQAIPAIVLALARNMPQIIKAIADGLKAGIGDVGNTGKQLIYGVWDGIKGTANWIWNKVKGFFGGLMDKIKKFLGIHSPSTVFRDEIGKMLPPGIAIGFEKSTPSVIKDMQSEMAGMVSRMQASISAQQMKAGMYANAGTPQLIPTLATAGAPTYNQIVNNYSPKALSPAETARQIRNATRLMLLNIKGR